MGGWIAMVTFCNNGLSPFPFSTIKSVWVGSKGFVIKLVNIRKNPCVTDIVIITQGIKLWCFDWFWIIVIVLNIDKINSQKSNAPDWTAKNAENLYIVGVSKLV